VALYLVTGGAGFIGSNLVEALLREGHDVRALDDLSSGRRENLADVESWAGAGSSRFTMIEGDIRQADVCRDAVGGTDFVLHLAAIPSVQRSVENPTRTNSVNVTGTLNLLDAARAARVRRFVFASSSSLYGESETLPKVETHPTDPISPYALQKLAGETYCRLYHRLYGTPTVALRYFNVFGPRQDTNSEYSAVIPRFATAARSGQAATVYGDGEQTRDFTFVANVIQANRRACEADPTVCGRAYNIACGERISLNGLLDGIGELLDVRVEREYRDARAGDIKHSLAGIELARAVLGYEPTVNLHEGLRRTLETY
jgi:nucleoside-diphosphate-sugar epimerase